MPYLALADVFLIYMASPILVTVFSVFLLGERVGVWRWLAVVCGFAGVVLIFPPSGAALTIPALVALAGSVSLALIMVLTRHLRGVGSYALITYQTMAVALAGGVILPTVWITPGPVDLALLCLLGLVATMAHFLINQAVSVAPASVVAPYQYTSIVCNDSRFPGVGGRSVVSGHVWCGTGHRGRAFHSSPRAKHTLTSSKGRVYCFIILKC